MPTAQAPRRMSPKVRRLLHEHGLQARAVAGTGTGTDGRVTTHDVLGPVTVRHGAAGGEVLASRLARRRLRGAGVDLTEAGRASDGRRVTRADADLVIDQRSVGSASPPVGQPRPTANEVEVDVALLLGSVAAAKRDFIVHNGFELSIEVVPASALAAVLVRRPELPGSRSFSQPPGDGRTYPGVHVGFTRSDARGPDIAVIPDAQDLTVAGLTRRARAAVERTDEPAPAAAHHPTVIGATEAAAQEERSERATLGLLTISDATPRRVTRVDHLGHEVVHTRPHVTVRLHHADRATSDHATALLEELRGAIASWTLPVGP